MEEQDWTSKLIDIGFAFTVLGIGLIIITCAIGLVIFGVAKIFGF